MKSIQKMLAQILILASILLKTSTVFSQCVNVIGPVGAPLSLEIQPPAGDYLRFMTGTSACSPAVAGIPTLPGIGANVIAPNYMLDILGTSGTTNLDVNISCPTCPNYVVGLGANATGYRIGDSMFAWHSGIRSSVFVGYNAGGLMTYPSGPNYPTGPGNTFVGNLSGYYNTNTTTTPVSFGIDNTYLGYTAGYGANTGGGNTGDSNLFAGIGCGYSNLSGTDDVFEGNMSGHENLTGDSDVFIGNQAGYHNISGWGNNFTGNYCGFFNLTGWQNVFSGDRCGYHNTSGGWNTFAGNHCGFSNFDGNSNSFYGKHCGYSNYNGSSNCFYGSHDGLLNVSGSRNAAYGSEAFYSNNFGDSNVVVGDHADYYGGAFSGGFAVPEFLNVFIGDWCVPSFLQGDSNVFLGATSDIRRPAAFLGEMHNSTSLGYGVIVTNDNQTIICNREQFAGIGMSEDPTGPMANLEIQTDLDRLTPPIGGGFIGSATPTLLWTTPNYYSGQGFSGLKFRDLTSLSATCNPSSPAFINAQGVSTYPKGVLSLDQYGNVIYIPTCCDSGAAAGGNYIGSCCTPYYYQAPNPEGCTYDPSIDLMSPTSSNPYAHNLWVVGNQMGKKLTNVNIGYNCQTPVLAKLNVLQNSGDYSTVCGYFENHDLGLCGVSSADPVIAIEGFCSNAGSPLIHQTQIAGWFQSVGSKGCCAYGQQYAIVVPQGGGNVEIGVPGALTNSIECPNMYMLDVYGSAFNYTGIWASDSTIKTNDTAITNPLAVIGKLKGYGFNYIHSATYDSGMAGRHYGFLSQQVARVLPSLVKTDNRGIKGVAYLEIIPWLVEGMKQQKQTNDSLRNTLDSLRSAFLGYIHCFDSLCGSSHHAPIRGNGNGGGGNGNSTGNTNPNNSQDVTLSMSSEPVLYQNTPNPFSTGTAINYFLPEGTMGAKMLFMDSYGKQLKSVELSQTGNGTLNITPDNLQSGIYSYSLVVDNKVIDTKRMVLQK